MKQNERQKQPRQSKLTSAHHPRPYTITKISNSQITTSNDGSQLDINAISYQSDSHMTTYNKLRKSNTHKEESYIHHLDLNETDESQLDIEMSRTVVRPIGYKGYWKKAYFQNLLC